MGEETEEQSDEDAALPAAQLVAPEDVEDPPLDVLQVGSFRQGLRGRDSVVVARHAWRRVRGSEKLCALLRETKTSICAELVRFRRPPDFLRTRCALQNARVEKEF